MSNNKKCRACLAERGEMKNMYEWGLCDDYFKFTDVQVKRSEGLSELLCALCEDVLNRCMSFRIQCIRSDLIMRDKQIVEANNLEEKHCLPPVKKDEKLPQDFTRSMVEKDKIIFHLSLGDINAKMKISCTYCKKIFYKPRLLRNHILKEHNKTNTIKLQFYCPYLNCNYFIDSGKDKHFSERKHLNQHLGKVHAPKTLSCINCKESFSRDTDLHRHIKVCSQIFKCFECGIQYNKKEPYMVHLLRKHPEVHKKLKEDKPTKRPIETVVSAESKSAKYDELIRSVSEFICCSPKRSFATQTFEEPNNVIDMSFPNLNNLDATDDRNYSTIETQTALDELLSIKTHNDDFFFDSDIDFETPKADTDLRASPRTDFVKSLFDNPNSNSPSFNSIEVQTESNYTDVAHDVMLSFATAETQTYFDQEMNQNPL